MLFSSELSAIIDCVKMRKIRNITNLYLLGSIDMMHYIKKWGGQTSGGGSAPILERVGEGSSPMPHFFLEVSVS